MRLKLLLLIMVLSTGILNAQDTIKSLLITEAYVGGANVAYFELTNMGTEPVQLNQFKFAEMRPWGVPLADGYWENPADRWWILPEYELAAGESYVIAAQWEFGPRQFAKGLDGYSERANKPEMIDLADRITSGEGNQR